MYHHVQQDYFVSSGLNLKIPHHAVIVDVGGHVGMFTLHTFVRSGLTAKIFTFEPIPQTRQDLVATVAGLDPQGTHIKVFSCGLSDHSGSVEFDYVPKGSALSSYKKVRVVLLSCV